MQTFSRSLGDSELSYFLPSRGDGVNDMYLHLGFRAPPRLVNAERVALAWAIARVRHPLLASCVVMAPGEYDSARFVYAAPASPACALHAARGTLRLRSVPKDALLAAYLNGPRTLSNECVAVLVLSAPHLADAGPAATPPASPTSAGARLPPPTGAADTPHAFDLLLCAAHFLGDGIALHTCADDLFRLLAGSPPAGGTDAPGCGAGPERATLSDTALRALLEVECARRCDPAAPSPLPPPLEARLPAPAAPLQRVAHDLAFRRAQARLIGGHAFARVSPAPSPAPAPRRHTLVRTVAFDPALTRRVLARCKREGVSVAHVLFALCNVAWARTARARASGTEWRALPMMMYSALNLRPHLAPPPAPALDSYWFLAVGYFNVVLPAFLLSADADAGTAHRTLFHRARMAKRQCAAAARTPLLAPYALRMARERGARAKVFAGKDDGAAPRPDAPPSPPVTPVSTRACTPPPSAAPGPARAPSTALVGLSLLGNLDGIYTHSAYAPLVLDTLTTGSRQRAGALLLFGYTFAGRLWVSLGWDREAYGGEAEGVGGRVGDGDGDAGEGEVAGWWRAVVGGVGEVFAEA